MRSAGPGGAGGHGQDIPETAGPARLRRGWRGMEARRVSEPGCHRGEERGSVRVLQETRGGSGGGVSGARGAEGAVPT